MQEEEILNFDQELFFVERWGVDERRVVISNSPSCLAFNDPPQKIMVEWKKDAQGDIFAKIKGELFKITEMGDSDGSAFGILTHQDIPCKDINDTSEAMERPERPECIDSPELRSMNGREIICLYRKTYEYIKKLNTTLHHNAKLLPDSANFLRSLFFVKDIPIREIFPNEGDEGYEEITRKIREEVIEMDFYFRHLEYMVESLEKLLFTAYRSYRS